MHHRITGALQGSQTLLLGHEPILSIGNRLGEDHRSGRSDWQPPRRLQRLQRPSRAAAPPKPPSRTLAVALMHGFSALFLEASKLELQSSYPGTWLPMVT